MHKKSTSTIPCLTSVLVVAVILTLIVAYPALAQTAVPATARQAASMPQYAARLAHSTNSQQGSQGHQPGPDCPMLSMQGRNGFWPLDGILYSNGPINGTTDAWVINFGFIVSNSFPQASGSGSITSLSFGAWLFPGDVLQSVEVSITDAEFGGNTYFDGVVNFTQSDCLGNQYGFNVCTETGSFTVDNLPQGTFWLNLQNASVNTGDPVYWDENSGPSLASQNSVGTIPSEAFSLTGTNDGDPNGCMPEQDGNFKVIHNFSGGEDGQNPSGLAGDRGGNLYGPVNTQNGNGMVYKMAQAGTGWIQSRLYNFLGGEAGGPPYEVTVGRNGVLYGAAKGGTPECAYHQSCGMIFSLRPSPTICQSISCSWRENLLYGFTDPTDAWQASSLVSDDAGNLYGISASGGDQEKGAVFELSPSIGGWIETILYSFTGRDDGGTPSSLLIGRDGNLYGTATGGGAYTGGVVFQLTPSASGWTESVVYSFPLAYFGTAVHPHSLVQDSAGTLFGEYEEWVKEGWQILGIVFMLKPTDGQWQFTAFRHDTDHSVDIFNNLAIDAAGNLYGTGGGTDGCGGYIPRHGFIFELARTNDSWQFTKPVSWDRYTKFSTSGNLALDAHGNLYGTTGDCGLHRKGTVWQFATH